MSTDLFFRSPLHSALKDITRGIHDDVFCLDFEKDYSSEFASSAPICEFRENKEDIKQLIEKIEIQNQD